MSTGSTSNQGSANDGSPIPANSTSPFIGSHSLVLFNPDGSYSAISESNPLPCNATFSGSITATNPSVGATGSPVPSDATAIGLQDAVGKLQIVSSDNPLPITGSISASNPSVSSIGSATPSSATLLGISDGTNLQPVSSTHPVPTSGKIIDSGGSNVATVSSGGAVKVDGSSVTQPVSGTFWQTTQPISAASLPLPTGAALETGGNLATIATNLPAKGQALAAASMPVVLTTLQVTALTPPAAITNYANETGGNLATIATNTTLPTPSFATVAVSSSGASTIVAAVTSKKIRVLACQLVANGAVNVKWQSHVTPTDITGLAYLAANGGYVLPYNPLGWFQTVSGEALDINLSGSVAVGGSITYVAV